MQKDLGNETLRFFKGFRTIRLISEMRRVLLVFLISLSLLASCSSIDSPVIESTVDTSYFDGSYVLAEATSISLLEVEIERSEDAERRKALEAHMQSEIDRFSNFLIFKGVIRSGKLIVREFSLSSGNYDGNTLTGKATWHEDIQDPGDMTEVLVELRLEGDILYFEHYELDSKHLDSVVLVKDPRSSDP